MRFLQRQDLDLICRAHQVVEDGYEFFAKRQLVTLFSAPNYCGEFDNAGAMMSVDETLMCSFQILKPAEKKTGPKYAATSVSCLGAFGAFKICGLGFLNLRSLPDLFLRTNQTNRTRVNLCGGWVAFVRQIFVFIKNLKYSTNYIFLQMKNKSIL